MARRPAVVVFDGTWPYQGIKQVREAHPEVCWVWSRRGMWRRGMNAEQLAKAAWFDDVLAPGELAEAYDGGLTSAAAGTRLGPVTLLDADELDDVMRHARRWGCRRIVGWRWWRWGRATSTTRASRPGLWRRRCGG